MQELDDIALLRKYAEENSEEAFSTLVSRHINKVYSVALRQTNNPHSAEEITQVVFVILATKAKELKQHPMLSGWIYQTARLTAVTFIRSEIRRGHREQEAYMQNILNETAPEIWPRIAPLLDTAMGHLNDADRHAVVLRFFDGKSMSDVGTALGLSEDAAKKRVARAVEKLQKFFFKSGVDSSATALAESISVHSVQTAPALLVKTVTAVALSKGAAASTSTLTLIKGALKVMTWTKMKTAIVTGVAIVLIGGTTATSIAVYRHVTAPQLVSRNSFHFAGYATPEATFESTLWAMSQSDFQSYTNGITPDGMFGRDAQNKTENEVTARNAKEIQGMTGFKILNKKTVLPDEVILTVQPEGTGHGVNTAADFILQRIDNEWKLAGTVQNKQSKTPRIQPDPNRPAQ